MRGGRSLCICGKRARKHFKICSYLHFSVHQMFKFGVRGENALTSLEEEMMLNALKITECGPVYKPVTSCHLIPRNTWYKHTKHTQTMIG